MGNTFSSTTDVVSDQNQPSTYYNNTMTTSNSILEDEKVQEVEKRVCDGPFLKTNWRRIELGVENRLLHEYYFSEDKFSSSSTSTINPFLLSGGNQPPSKPSRFQVQVYRYFESGLLFRIKDRKQDITLDLDRSDVERLLKIISHIKDMRRFNLRPPILLDSNSPLGLYILYKHTVVMEKMTPPNPLNGGKVDARLFYHQKKMSGIRRGKEQWSISCMPKGRIGIEGPSHLNLLENILKAMKFIYLDDDKEVKIVISEKEDMTKCEEPKREKDESDP